MQELNYTRCGDYYIPDICLDVENRPIGRWGRMHKEYIAEHRPVLYNQLCLSGELWAYLADLNEQTQSRFELIIGQMKTVKGVREESKAPNQMVWVGMINGIRSRTEEIVKNELIYRRYKIKRYLDNNRVLLDFYMYDKILRAVALIVVKNVIVPPKFVVFFVITCYTIFAL